MADVIPLGASGGAPNVPGLPSPAREEARAGQVDEETRAKRTLAFHRKGLDSRRLRDLTAEKYLLHIDGEGQSQWYDVFKGQRLRMMPVLNGFSPTQDNQLRPIIDNFVAHLTTQPYRFVVETKPDSKSRKAALIDQALINAEVRSQKWNYLMAEAKMLASATGFCPIHSMWRDDPEGGYEAVFPGQVPGHIDSFVGNPFDHVFNAGAKRASVHRQTWGRTLPADLVRQVFGRPDLEGTDRMPSASAYQRIARKWTRLGGGQHGYSTLTSSTGHEEMIALIYDEILPGYDPLYPEGSLCIIALQGSAGTKAEDASNGGGGRPVHLWSGPLPAGVFSSINVYSHHRFDDAHGKPYIADIDDDQVELNQRLAIFKDYMRRASRPQLGGSAGVDVDTIGFEGDTFFEIDAGVAPGSPLLQWLEYPGGHVSALIEEIRDIRERMYRKAGWQAASRGETGGESGKAIIALQQADDSIMGPIAQRTSEELEDLAKLNWRIRKEFMDAPTIIEHAGEEVAHLVGAYIDKTMMSDSPPSFRLVSGFGTSTEAKAQQLLNLLQVTDAVGEPVLTTRQFKKQWPDQSLYHEVDDPRDVRERRPRVVNEMIRQAAEQKAQEIAAQFQQWQPSMADPFTQQLGMIVEMEVAQSEDVLMDDDLTLNIETLSVITQDPTAHPVARRAAIARQMRYLMWLQGQQVQQADQQVQQEAAGAQAKQQAKAGGPQPNEAFNPAREGNTASAQGMVQADRQFEQRIA